MKQDTRDLGTVATVWVIAAIVVLALGRVAVPAGPIAGHNDGVPSARSLEAAEPPADDIRDPEHRGREQEHAVADRLPSAEAVPLIRLAAEDKHVGSEPRAAVSPAERHPWPTAAAHAPSMDGEPASGHDATTVPRVAHASPQPQPAEAKPKPKPQPQPAEAKPKPKPQPQPPHGNAPDA